MSGGGAGGRRTRGAPRPDAHAALPGARHLLGEDIITAGNGNKLGDEAAPGVALLPLKPGQEVTLQLYRDARPREVGGGPGSPPPQYGPAARP